MLLAQKRDTSDVWRQFAIWILVDPDYGFIRFTDPESLQNKAIQLIARLYIDDCKDIVVWKSASDFAYVASSAGFATNPMHPCACAAAEAAAYAANFAYDDIANSAAACSTWHNFHKNHELSAGFIAKLEDDWTCHYKLMANKLIELLQAAPLKENP